MKQHNKILISSLLLMGHLYGDCQNPPVVEQVKRGNFSLPTSQQPGPLLSLGQNIVDKGDILAVGYTDYLRGCNTYALFMNYGALYGITDSCSFLLLLPCSSIKTGKYGKNAGLGDLFGVIEYAFYQKLQKESTHQATIFGSLSVPTGSVGSLPLLGRGGPSYLLGATWSYYSPEWFYYVSFGGLIATKGHGVRANSDLIYESGFGRNIGTKPGWIFAWMIEGNGISSTRNRFGTAGNANNGSTLFFVTPSLWISSERMVLQVGLSCLPVQRLFGTQDRFTYGVSVDLAWKFNS